MEMVGRLPEGGIARERYSAGAGAHRIRTYSEKAIVSI